jgi:predicted RNase H-like nuclease (RuvC/YqgF family)
VSSEFPIEASTSLSVPDHLLLRRSPPLIRFRRRPKDHLVLSVLEEQASSGLTEEEARKFGLNGSTTRVGYDDAAVQARLASNGNGSANGNGAA